MTRSIRKQRQEETRQALIAAARRMIRTRSIGGLSIRALCADAGYTQGAFYSNFSSKDAILLEVLETHMQERFEELTRALSDDPSELALAHWLSVQSHRSEWGQLAAELQLQSMRDEDFGNAMQAAEMRLVAAFSKVLETLCASTGATPQLTPAQIAKALMGVWNAVAVHGGYGTPDDTRQVIEKILRGLLAPA